MKIIYALTIVGVCAWAMGCGGDATYNTYVTEVAFPLIQTDAGSVDAVSDSGEDGMAIRARGNIQMTMGNHVSQQALNYTLDAAGQTTVQIGISQSSASVNANGPPNLRALVSWMTSGVSIDRIVTVGGGTSVTGSSEAVSVSLIDETNPTVPTDIDYQVTVAAVPGSRPSTSAPPTLIPLISEAKVVIGTVGIVGPGFYSQVVSNTTISISVPPDAGVQSVYVGSGIYESDATTATVVVVQFDIIGNALRSYVASEVDGFVPLHPLATSVEISNLSNTDSIDGLNVTWGIDG